MAKHRTTVYIDSDFRRALGIWLAIQGFTFSQFVDLSMQEYFAQRDIDIFSLVQGEHSNEQSVSHD